MYRDEHKENIMTTIGRAGREAMQTEYREKGHIDPEHVFERVFESVAFGNAVREYIAYHVEMVGDDIAEQERFEDMLEEDRERYERAHMPGRV